MARAPRGGQDQPMQDNSQKFRRSGLRRDVGDEDAKLVATAHPEGFLGKQHQLLEGVVRGECKGKHSVHVGKRLLTLAGLHHVEDRLRLLAVPAALGRRGVLPGLRAGGFALCFRRGTGIHGHAGVALGHIPVPDDAFLLAALDRVVLLVDALGQLHQDLLQHPRGREVLPRPRVHVLLPILDDSLDLFIGARRKLRSPPPGLCGSPAGVR
mmetsp:Transcript_108946/g.338407  ORF Transcript_108946/g.338407 Transcript_108946/m.338407 type:complete len:211 (-) Transcript_108946:140-772(-)